MQTEVKLAKPKSSYHHEASRIPNVREITFNCDPCLKYVYSQVILFAGSARNEAYEWLNDHLQSRKIHYLYHETESNNTDVMSK